MNHIVVEKGLTLHLLQTRKFKTNVITALLRSELTKQNAANNAMLAGILRLGCEKFKTESEIARECEELYGAALEINVVKKGEEHMLQFYIETIKGEELFQRAGAFLNNLIFMPLTESKSFERERFILQRNRALQTIAGRINDKRKYALERCVEIMCENERFGVAGDGCEEEVAKITPANLYEYYCGAIAGNALEVCVIGDMDADYCVSWAKEYFGREKVKIAAYKHTEIIMPQGELKVAKERMNVSQGKLVIGARCGVSPIGREFYSLLLASEIIGGGNSKLFRNIREKHSLCYYINSFLYRAKSIMIIQAGIDEKDYEQTFKLIAEQLKLAGDGDITDNEQEYAKNALISQIETLKDSPQGLTDFYMTNALLGDSTNISEVRGTIESIKREEIIARARSIRLDTAYFLANTDRSVYGSI